MIFTVFLNLIYGFISFFVALLPIGGTLPQVWVSGVYTVWGYINAFAFIVPVSTLVYCLGIAMIFHLFIFGWKSMHWVYGLIRGNRI